jgi:hypothetical protein
MFEFSDGGSAVAVVAATGATERHLVALVGTTRHPKGAGGSAPESLSLSILAQLRERETRQGGGPEELHTVNLD